MLKMKKVCLWDKDERAIGSVEMDIKGNNELAFRFDVSEMREYTIEKLAEMFCEEYYSKPYDGYEIISEFNISNKELYDTINDRTHSDFSDHENDWYAQGIALGQTDLREYFSDISDELMELIEIWEEWHLKIVPGEVIYRAIELFDSLPEIAPQKVWRDLGVGVCLQDVLNELEDDQIKELASHIGWRGQEAYICIDGYIGYRDRGWWGNFEDEILGTLTLAPEYWRDSLIEWGIYDKDTDGINEDADWEVVRDFMTDDILPEFVGQGDDMI